MQHTFGVAPVEDPNIKYARTDAENCLLRGIKKIFALAGSKELQQKLIAISLLV